METDEPPPKSAERDEAAGSAGSVIDGILRFAGWIFVIFLAAPFVGCLVSFSALSVLPSNISGPIGFYVTLIFMFTASIIAFFWSLSGR